MKTHFTHAPLLFGLLGLAFGIKSTTLGDSRLYHADILGDLADTSSISFHLEGNGIHPAYRNVSTERTEAVTSTDHRR